jgi:hypothetical protein
MGQRAFARGRLAGRGTGFACACPVAWTAVAHGRCRMGHSRMGAVAWAVVAWVAVAWAAVARAARIPVTRTPRRAPVSVRVWDPACRRDPGICGRVSG